MTTRRYLALLTIGVLAVTFSACSDEQSSSESSLATTTSGAGATSTTTTTVAASTTSTTSSTTSTSTTSTTTTIPKVIGLGLSAQGLGDALFGADADGVIDYVSSIVGAPSNDSGWADPVAVGAPCPGTQIRFVDWNDLKLFFTDNSPAATGLRHFSGYTYGPAFAATIDPYGLETLLGVGVGSTIDQLLAAYPGALVNPGDEISGPTFFIEDGLRGFLTGTAGTDTIMSFVGGYECGE